MLLWPSNFLLFRPIARSTAIGLALLIGTFVLPLAVPSDCRADLITYSAGGGRTASADFSFVDADTLLIHLCETTPAGATSDTGAGVILTSIGFQLPAGVTLVVAGSTVVIAAGSQSVNFSLGNLTAGADVSGEWGVSVGKADPGVGTLYDFASVNTAQVTQLAGANRDGPVELDGPQAGLLDDSAAAGGLGVVDNCVDLRLNLSRALTGAEQTAFLASLPTSSIVEYGSDEFFGTPGGPAPIIPVPPGIILMGIGAVGLLGFRLKNRRKAVAA